MTLISFKAENSRPKGIFRLEFSDGPSLLLASRYLSETTDPLLWEEAAINEKNTGNVRELTSYEEESFRFAAACYEAEKSALRLIARAEQNSPVLKAKLQRRGHNPAVVHAVISSLLDRNLLDDRRYAEQWIRSRLSSGKITSPFLLNASLGKKGISRISSREAMDTVLDKETEYALLLRYLRARGRDIKNAISQKIQLKKEGFSADVINRYYEDFQ